MLVAATGSKVSSTPTENFVLTLPENSWDDSVDVMADENSVAFDLTVNNIHCESRMEAIRRGAEEEDEFFKQVTYFPYDVTRTSNGSGVIITPAPEDMRTSSA